MQWLFIILSIAVAIAAGWWMYRIDTKRAVPHAWVTSILRALVVLLTLLLIVAPDFNTTKNETQDPIVLFLQDNSLSIANALKTDSTAYQEQAEQLLDKLEGKYKVVRWGFGEGVQRNELFTYNQEVTDISKALSEAQEYYGGQNLGAIILATDGRFNQGVNPAYQNLPLSASTYTVGLGDSTVQKDIRIANTYSNRTATLKNDFEIRADIIANRCNGQNTVITLTEGNTTLARKTISINSDKYDRAISFTLRAEKPGIHHYTISIPTIDGEQNTINNKRNIFVEVQDRKKKILIAAVAPHPDVAAIKAALKGLDNYTVTTKVGTNISASTNDYDVFILHQIPYSNNDFFRQVSRSKKPVWYIVGGKTDGNALSQGSKPVAVNFHNSMRNALAMHNSNFNFFALPKNIKEVTAELPPLVVPNGMTTLLPNADMLFYDKRNNVPLWAVQQGNTATAILCGEGLWRWRMYEYKNFNTHQTIDECIQQTVSFLATSSQRQQFSVVLPKYVWSNRQAVNMNAYLLNANNEQINTPEINFTIADSLGHKKEYSFERSGSSYKLNIGVWAKGKYTYTATTQYNGKTLSATGSFVVESQPVELLETSANFAALYSLANKYDGAFLTRDNMMAVYDSLQHNKNIKPLITTEVTTVPLIDRKWFFFLILLVAVVEWLLRKYWLAQ